MTSSRSTSAFALIEVVLALGVAAIALTAVIGLLSVAFGSSKASLDDTLISTMAENIISDLRRQYFVDNTLIPPANISKVHPAGDPALLTSGILPGTDDVSQGSTPVAVKPTAIFFDVSGMRLQNTDQSDITDKADALAKGAVYQCALILQGDGRTLSAVGSDGSKTRQAVNLLNVTITFTWPAQATNPPNRTMIHASVSRY